MQVGIIIGKVAEKPVQKIMGGVTIKRVIFNKPVTVVFWSDGTKTTVKCQENDVYTKEAGLIAAIAKKSLGNTSKWYNVIKKVLAEDNAAEAKKEAARAAKLQKEKEKDVFGELSDAKEEFDMDAYDAALLEEANALECNEQKAEEPVMEEPVAEEQETFFSE